MTTQAPVFEMFLGGVWTAVPLFGTGIEVVRGLDAGGSWPRQSTFTCEINNDTLDYDPSLPTALLYGIAGRNTRARIRIGGSTRLWAEAAKYVPSRSVEHVPAAAKGRAAVAFTADGLLGRIGQWTEKVRSPMYRTIAGRASSIGHWSLEDDSDAQGLANSATAPPVGVGTFRGEVTLGDSQAPDGATQSVKVSATSVLGGRFSTASTTAGWQVCFAFKLAAVPPSATYGALLRWVTSNGYTWLVEVNDTTFQFTVTAADGTVLWVSTALFGAGVQPNAWVTLRVRAEPSGGNVLVAPAWYAQGMSTSLGIAASFAGAVGVPRSWAQDGNAIVAGGWFSHVYGVTGVADSLVGSTAQKVFNGYRGEDATTRYNRVLLEQNLNRFTIGLAGDSPPMGPQGSMALIDLLKEIRDTEDGRIDDERFDIALTKRSRRDMYGLAPALTLTYPSQVAVPFRKVIGTAGAYNRVTAKNRDGGEYTVFLASGAMSVQAPPLGISEIKRQVDVNVATEDQLVDIATFHLAKGTLERPRYEEVAVDLLANPGLVASASAVREGDMLRITGYEADPVDLMVVGIRDVIGDVERTITFKTEPYEPYQVDLWDAATIRYDSRTSTLAAGATSSATALSLTTVEANDVWSTTPGYQLMIGGERVTVTAMTGAAGAGPYTQTATVTRQVNGVVKAQVSGTEVHIADPKRWGL